jgi:hypothetical protein
MIREKLSETSYGREKSAVPVLSTSVADKDPICKVTKYKNK